MDELQDLTPLCNFIKGNWDELAGFIVSIDVYYIWMCRGRHKPYLGFWTYSSKTLSAKYYPKIDGYKIWLSFFEEFHGTETLIYYPKYVKKGQQIKVIIKDAGCFKDGYIKWQHGVLGLFKNMILPLLSLQELPHNHTYTEDCDHVTFIKGKENYTNLVAMDAEYKDTPQINKLLDLVQEHQECLLYLNDLK